MRYIFLAAALFVVNALTAQRPQVVFELKENPAIIEGMTVDAGNDVFYFGESISKHLLKYSKKGESLGYIDAGKDGMTSVLGMTVRAHHLWVCGAIRQQEQDIMCVFQYDTQSGKLLHRYPDTSGRAKLFNDIAIAADGSAYATDAYTRALYKIDTSSRMAILFLQSDSLKDANGITSNGDYLFVSTSRGFAKVNILTRNITLVNLRNFMTAGIDGLYYYNNSLIGIQNVFFPVTIGRYYFNENATVINNAKALATNDPLFVIPTTGAIDGNDFYFMANNNLGLEKEAAKKNPLKKVSVVKLVLD